MSTAEEIDRPNTSAALSPSTPSPALRRLQRELAAALAESRSLRELLEELPAILERKFQQRLQAILIEQRQLERDNALLQQHLLTTLSGSEPLLSESRLPAAHPNRSAALQAPAGDLAETDPGRDDRSDSPITRGLGLRRALRRLHR
ncbi:MAG: hypothetical protein ACK6AD_16170 [Cyanobacteriota bacterium]